MVTFCIHKDHLADQIERTNDIITFEKMLILTHIHNTTKWLKYTTISQS
jgi:hypothetical protein